MSKKELASEFVEFVLALVRKSQGLNEVTSAQTQIIERVMTAAGFEDLRVVLGKLQGNYRDQDGSSTGEKYSINSLSPFKITTIELKDHYRATGWLDFLFRRVSDEWYKNEHDSLRAGKPVSLADLVIAEIERSIPLQPIQLTIEGDFLEEYPGEGYAPDHTRDNNEMGSCVGLHKYCNGWMDRHRATVNHDAIVCRKCHLRVLFPKPVKTYGALRSILFGTIAPVAQ